MDTKFVKGIPIKRTPLFKLQKMEGKSWQFGNQIEKLGRWQNLKKILEKMETSWDWAEPSSVKSGCKFIKLKFAWFLVKKV